MSHHIYLAPPTDPALRAQADRRRAVLTAAGCATYVAWQYSAAAGIVCLCCGLSSANLHDLRNRYLKRP